jgi:hypothetical protein
MLKVLCQSSLNDFTGGVSFTSLESYKKLSKKSSHVALIFRLIKQSLDGYTDGELHEKLNGLGVFMQRCNVGARRHDINRLLGCSVVVNVNCETRSFKGRKQKVWRVNEYGN